MSAKETIESRMHAQPQALLQERDHLFSTYTKFIAKATFRTFRYAHVFLKKFLCVLIGWFQMKLPEIKDTLKTFDDFKNKRKSVQSNVFYYVAKSIYILKGYSIQYTLR